MCGESGIRTPEGLASLTVFKTAAFNHSANSPYNIFINPQRFFRTAGFRFAQKDRRISRQGRDQLSEYFYLTNLNCFSSFSG